MSRKKENRDKAFREVKQKYGLTEYRLFGSTNNKNRLSIIHINKAHINFIPYGCFEIKCAHTFLRYIKTIKKIININDNKKYTLEELKTLSLIKRLSGIGE